MNIDNKKLMLTEFTKLTQEVIHWWVNNLDLAKQNPLHHLHWIRLEKLGVYNNVIVVLSVKESRHPEYLYTLSRFTDLERQSKLNKIDYFFKAHSQYIKSECTFVDSYAYQYLEKLSYRVKLDTNIDLLNFISNVTLPYEYILSDNTSIH